MTQGPSQANGGQGARNGIHGDNGATFEQSYTRLQEVVQKLSAGNLTLQEALGAFEEGMQLADRCTHLLDEADLRIKQVSAKAARAGSEAMSELDEMMRKSPASEEVPVVEMESYERTVILDSGPSAPAKPTPSTANTGNSGAGRAQLEGRNPASQGPAQTRPGTGAPGKPVPEELELDPLFDDED